VTGWRIAVDRGGTFTDVVASAPDGVVTVRKLISRDGVIGDAVEELVGPEGVLEELRVGTTVATNALLTRTGPRTGLVVTRGFGDVLEIGHQARPDLFALFVVRAAPLCECTVEVGGRLLPDGTVEQPVDDEETEQALRALRERGIEAVAVALMHGFLHPQHERRIGAIARRVGFAQVTLSSDAAPEIGLVARAETAVADAFVTPGLVAWTAALEARVGSGTALRFMKSSGGLADRGAFGGVQAPLSGPAGGVVACGAIAVELGLPRVLGLDMGGTSTDVCRWAGELERRSEITVAGVRIRTPCVDVHTVAAGGGSIVARADGRLRVGPASAGADPGPACYGRGGPAAVTDANAVLGRIQPDFFPALFGADGRSPLDLSAAALKLDPTDAAGALAVADATMAAAIAEISSARGHDPAEHALIAFGGAAGQHGCSVARALGIRHVLVHPRAGVLSAHGIAAAERLAMRTVPAMVALTSSVDGLRAGGRAALSAEIEACVRGARDEAIAELGGGEVIVRERLELRYVGSESSLHAADRADFERLHERLFGFARPAAAVEVVAIRVEVRAGAERASPRPTPPPRRPLPTAAAVRRVGYADADGALAWHDTPVIPRAAMTPGCTGPGPLLIPGPVTTVVVDPGWTVEVDAAGILHLRATDGPAPRRRGTERDPVRLELFWRRFMSIATRMGETLRRVAWSVNIKERLDFSCAVFDSDGHLVTNAPHIPVHLGAMGETVRGLAGRLGDELRAGRSWAVNDPFAGGSHLPDITVITPVFRPGATRPFAWVAGRGHHQDVGGITPGSMPPHSTSLADEGVCLVDLLLVTDGASGPAFRDEGVRAALASGPHPCRTPDVVLADLVAQVAANTLGVRLLNELAEAEGEGVVTAYMGHILDVGEEAVSGWIAEQPRGMRRFADGLDDGTPVEVSVEVTGGRLVVDFAGTGAPSATNLNAPPAVVRAALLYVLRCVVGRDIPLNEGCLRTVDLRLPSPSLLDPPPGSAVVGGNVETSQRIVDVLLGALGASAAAQGTMNNLTFGDGSFGYYETLGGGAGAGPGVAGASAVHTHMTNTRMTDPEVLERRCPVLVRETSVRRGSGGEGRWQGGDGLVRRLEARAPLEASLLSERRVRAPFGLAGGLEGARGEARRIRPDGSSEALPGRFTVHLDSGDEIEIRTPGGGGWGPPQV